MRPIRRALALTLLAVALASDMAGAARVRDLTALHKNGQTFLTWTNPPGTGWQYAIYTSDSPILYGFNLWELAPTATVSDSTWCDRRLSSLRGQTFGYRLDDSLPDLADSQSVAVLTPAAAGARYYCVMVSGNGVPEDRYMEYDENTMLNPVVESVGTPLPIYQRTLDVQGTPVEVYTLWASHVARPHFPLMANRAGVAFDCGIVRGDPGGVLMVRPHHRGGSFLDCYWGQPGQWRLMLDDPIPTLEINTFWFGYHEGYDLHNYFNWPPPTSGVVRNYTLARMLYTLDWARGSFDLDTTRVYAYGYSMGGIGSVMLALHARDRIAAVMSFVGKFDFGFLEEPDTTSAFNPGHNMREVANRLWGEVPTGLPSCEGPGIFQMMNFGYLAEALRDDGLPPIFAFNGKRDNVVGWAEKLPFYRAMNRARLGGAFFWDQRDHTNGATANWSTQYDPGYLTRFRTNLSFPAISECSANHNPGIGTATSGDSVGTINGFVEWDPDIVDTPERWEVTLRLRALAGRFEHFYPPPSLTAWVTPRRLQQFVIQPLGLYQRTITRLDDGAVIDQIIEQADSTGLLTLTWVPIDREGTRLTIQPVLETAGVGDPAAGVLRLALEQNPVHGRTRFALTAPRAGEARVELLDVAGRHARTLVSGPVAAGTTRHALSADGLAGGVYFLRARVDGLESVRRVVLLP